MDYRCAKFQFGDFGLSRFGFVVRTDIGIRLHDRITESHVDADGRDYLRR